MIMMLLFILAVLALLLVVFAALVRRAPRGEERIRLIPKRLMTAAEHELLEILEGAVPGCRVHAQVAMGALIQPEQGLGRSDRAHWRNRFSQKIIDFVLEDRSNGDVVALVELDDRTHAAARDQARDRLTAACGYCTVRIPSSPRPSTPAIADRIAAALGDHDDRRVAALLRPAIQHLSDTAKRRES